MGITCGQFPVEIHKGKVGSSIWAASARTEMFALLFPEHQSRSKCPPSPKAPKTQDFSGFKNLFPKGTDKKNHTRS